MYKKKSIILMCLAVLLIVQIALGSSVNIETLPLKNKIYDNESAIFNITIQNNLENDTFVAYSLDVNWDIATEPSEDRISFIENETNKTIMVVATPLKPTTGLHGFGVNIKGTKSGYVKTESLFVDITSTEQKVSLTEYLPTVRIKCEMPVKIDPREGGVLKITLENRNPRDIDELNVFIRSKKLTKDYVTNLAPKGRLNSEKTLEFPIEVGPMHEPMSDTIQVWATTKALNQNYKFEANDVSYEIISYGEIQEERDSSSTFLTRKEVLSFKNVGNIPRSKVLERPIGNLERKYSIITASDNVPEPEVVETETGTILRWQIDLDLEDDASISISTDYYPLFKMVIYPLVIIIVLVLGYYLFRKSLVVTKKIKIAEKHPAGIATLDVKIAMKNRGMRRIRNVKVVDRLPRLIQLVSESHVGMISPAKVLKDPKKGTLLQWELGAIEPMEERMIMYRVKTRLGLLGRLVLPATTVRYGYREGKRNKKVKSRRMF